MSTESEISTQIDEKKFPEAIFWGGVLLWAGMIFGADYFEFLPQIGEAGAWSWIFLGVGIYGLLLGVIRLASHTYPNPTTWDWIWAIVFIVIGAAGFLAINIPWWLILILIGVVILGSALIRRD